MALMPCMEKSAFFMFFWSFISLSFNVSPIWILIEQLSRVVDDEELYSSMCQYTVISLLGVITDTLPGATHLKLLAREGSETLLQRSLKKLTHFLQMICCLIWPDEIPKIGGMVSYYKATVVWQWCESDISHSVRL